MLSHVDELNKKMTSNENTNNDAKPEDDTTDGNTRNEKDESNLVCTDNDELAMPLSPRELVLSLSQNSDKDTPSLLQKHLLYTFM